MLPRFSIVKQQTASINTVLLNLSWGTLVLGFTISRKSPEIDFEDELYPQQRLRNIVAITFMVFVHFIVAYLLWTKKVEYPLKHGAKEGQLIFLNLQAKKESDKPKPPKTLPQKRPQRVVPRQNTAITAKPAVESIKSTSPLPAPVVDTMSQVAAARERRRALEEEAARENQAQIASQGPSENDIALARIKANIQAANYNRKGTNGIFQVLDMGVQTGRFSFRGWTNDPHESTRQTYEVDAGVGGDVKLALIRRMIRLIRAHYTGDFNWESQRLDRVIVLSARPQDTASLEAFMMNEFFPNK